MEKRTGLQTTVAHARLEKNGPNIITGQSKKNIFKVFFAQFNNFLTILLIGAAIVSIYVGERIDGLLIIAIVTLNALFGLYQEKKANEAIAALKTMTKTMVRVVRDGVEQEVESAVLVEGDIVLLEEGNKVPADAIIIESRNFEVNESALTGESLGIEKKAADEIFMGTIVAYGRAVATVTQTGMRTKFGQIAAQLAQTVSPPTPLQKKLASLSRLIGIVGIAIAGAVFVVSLLQGETRFPALLLAISLAVAVVPEGLPAVLTITLSIGVGIMARKKAIIRKLSAIEALGGVTLIATDKTGTLTTNAMRVREVYCNGELSGVVPPTRSAAYQLLLENGVLCSTASLIKKSADSEYEALGDPTESALLYMAVSNGLVIDELRTAWKIKEEMPFDSVTKKMSVWVESPSGQSQTFTKGALESVIEDCQKVMVHGKTIAMLSTHRREIESVANKWAKKGFRVLAFSYADGGHVDGAKSASVFLGLVAIHDPPRPESKEAIARARSAGIEVVMITGDNAVTARAIGESVGLMKPGDTILSGQEVDQLSDEELTSRLSTVRIFSRTTPFQKARIVGLYQALGEVVAVTGDGVNDAIALKKSDVGVAMGRIGSDVARETADMVITDDNFATIVNAIEEGRNIIKNVKNAVTYLLSCNIAEAAIVIASVAIGLPHILFAIQLLYINLITDGVPALALAFSPRQKGVMMRGPERNQSVLIKSDVVYIALVGLFSSVIVICSYYLFGQGEVGKTAVFSVLTLTQSFIFVDLWLSHRSIFKNMSLLRGRLFAVSFLLPFVLQFLIVTTPLLSKLFKIQSVSWIEYLWMMALAALIVPCIELVVRMRELKLSK